MARYKVIKDLGYFEDEPLLPNLTVGEQEPEFIGLFDSEGNPIFRLPIPIGFGRDNEW
jgi:hypothetical protein